MPVNRRLNEHNCSALSPVSVLLEKVMMQAYIYVFFYDL
jgi:hypothetical protein